jgi:hypothetical protein
MLLIRLLQRNSFGILWVSNNRSHLGASMETSVIGRTQFLLDTLGEGLREFADSPPTVWEAVAHFYLVRAILADIQRLTRRKRSVIVNTPTAIVLGHAMAAKVETVNRKERRPQFGWIHDDA